MPYTQTNITLLADELSGMLGQSSYVFWTQDELKFYIREALRTWNCHTAYFRERRSFTTLRPDPVVNTRIYDLRNPVAPALSGLLDVDTSPVNIINYIQYHLMEPVYNFGGIFVPSYPTTAMYPSSAVINTAITKALAKWNFDTGVIVNLEPVADVPPAPSYQVSLNEEVTDVRRVQIEVIEEGLSMGRYPIRRTDEFETNAWASPNALMNEGTPDSYSVVLSSTQPAFKLISRPDITGQIEIISVRSSQYPPLDWIWAVKWLALYYLLSQDEQSRDYFRAQYCLKRYNDSLILSRIFPSILQAYVNGRPVTVVSSPTDMDTYMPGWQNTPGLPQDLIQHGWNLIEFYPFPDNAYDVQLELCVSAQTDDTPLQLAPEHIQAILGYARHIATFKMGGEEFIATESDYQFFFQMAMEYNSRLRTEAKNFMSMRDNASKDKESRYPRRTLSSYTSQEVTSGESE